MAERDPQTALLWLRRIRQSLDRLRATSEKASLATGSNLGIGCVVAIAGWFVVAIVVACVAAGLLKMDSKSSTYGAILSITSLSGGVLAPFLWFRHRRNAIRKECAEIEARIQREAKEFAEGFPETMHRLFRTEEDFSAPELLAEAIAFLERQEIPKSAVDGIRSDPSHAAEGTHPYVGQMIGGCRLVSKLGEGGMGVVYKAQHIGLDIPVTVKLLRTASGGERTSIDRFLQEARAAAKLKHPNIVGVYNVGCEAAVYFIVMEFVEGGSLQDMLTHKGRLPIPHAVRLISEVCKGLHFAHQHKIIHRDIKPANILLDGQGGAKVADLGLAKRLDEDLAMTQSNMMMGTPYYLSPEQALDGRNVDHRSDIYSLGCTFYQLVCGKVPYGGDTLPRIILAHAKSPIPDPRAANPEISERLATIIMKTMAKRPKDRYASTRDILVDLTASGIV